MAPSRKRSARKAGTLEASANMAATAPQATMLADNQMWAPRRAQTTVDGIWKRA